MIEILSNGSKWAGQEPDSIDVLLDVLNREPLDPTFENCGDFIDPSPTWGKYGTTPSPYPDNPNVVSFFGNFLKVSHVFNIHTDDTEIIEKLTVAIRANQQRTDYIKARKAE